MFVPPGAQARCQAINKVRGRITQKRQGYASLEKVRTDIRRSRRPEPLVQTQWVYPSAKLLNSLY